MEIIFLIWKRLKKLFGQVPYFTHEEVKGQINVVISSDSYLEYTWDQIDSRTHCAYECVIYPNVFKPI